MNNEPQEKNEGATPRTDAAEMTPSQFPIGAGKLVPADFARTLERENASLRAQLAARPTAPEPEQQGEARTQIEMAMDILVSAGTLRQASPALNHLRKALNQLATPARVDEGRVRELEGALRAILADMPIFDCGDFHHAKKDRHDYYPCPVVARFETAIKRASALLTPPVSATKAPPPNGSKGGV